MHTVESARSLILKSVKPLSPQTLPLSSSFNRILSQNIVAKESQPPWDNSAVDGFAVKSADLRRASKQNPAKLILIDSIFAGQFPKTKVESGTAIKIMTGAPVPSGADAVVMKEFTRFVGNTVEVFSSVEGGENIRRKGEDVSRGKIVLKTGQKLNPAAIGLCASLGYVKLRIIPRVKVAVVSTGNELVKYDQPLTSGKIRNSNSWILRSLLENLDCELIDLGIVKDDPAALRKALERAFRAADAVVTSGGVSVGEADFVQEVLRKIGAKILLWKVAMKPGKPLLFAECKGKPFFGLPGNPVSSFATFQLFVRPALLKMGGHSPDSLTEIRARLAAPLEYSSGRRSFLRGRLIRKKSGTYVEILRAQGSHQLAALAHSNCLIDVPAGKVKYYKGKGLSVLLIN